RTLPVALRTDFGQLVFSLTQQSVANFGNALQIAASLFLLLFDLEFLDAFLQLLNASDGLLLFLPTCLQGVRLLANLRQLFFHGAEALFGVGIAFAFQRLALDFKRGCAAL